MCPRLDKQNKGLKTEYFYVVVIINSSEYKERTKNAINRYAFSGIFDTSAKNMSFQPKSRRSENVCLYVFSIPPLSPIYQKFN